MHFVLHPQQHPGHPFTELKMLIKVGRLGRQALLVLGQFSQTHADVSRVLKSFFQQAQIWSRTLDFSLPTQPPAQSQTCGHP
ncbi:MAG: hypothetical protein O2990_04530 [Bacteroidetes bacterium]|nr:hypothetical protein [Bacteroidota bacterium]